MTREQEKNKDRSGFTLFEVVVTMGIVAIFIAACSNVFTSQHKNRTANPPHGRVECYWGNDNKVHQRTFYENTLAGDEIRTDNRCIFTPTRDAAYVIVSAVGGGGAGGESLGGTAGEFTNRFMSSTTHSLLLEPGRAATYPVGPDGGIGGSTVVSDIGANGQNLNQPQKIFEVVGGATDFFATGSDAKLGGCSVVYTQYPCDLPVYCETDNITRKVKLHYCYKPNSHGNAYDDYADGENITSGSYSSDAEISYTTIFNSYGSGNLDDENFLDGLIIYDKTYDNSSTDTVCNGTSSGRKYTLSMKVIGNNTEYQDVSDMAGYINTLNITGGIKDLTISPGTGGAIHQNGGDGAVIVVW